MTKNNFRDAISSSCEGGTSAQGLSGADTRAVMLTATALCLFGAFVGCALYRLPGLSADPLYDNLIERYFVALFYRCSSARDVLSVLISCMTHEIVPLLLIFLGGFTIFTGFISGAVLLWRGVVFGFAFSMLEFSSKSGLLTDSIYYLACRFALLSLTAILCAHAFGFYFPKRKPRLFSSDTLRYIMVFLKITALAAADVCLTIFMIYLFV